MRRAYLLLAATLALIMPAAASADQEPAGQTVALLLSTTTVEYGEQIVATGRVEPAAAGLDVAVEAVDGATSIELARTSTDELGGFAIRFKATRGGEVRARIAGSDVASEIETLAVLPRVRLQARRGTAFLGARIRGRVWPASYAETVALTVSRGGSVLAHATARLHGGRLRAMVPTPGVGAFRLAVDFPGAIGLSPRTVDAKLTATGRTVSVGSTGPEIHGLIRRLAELHFRVPGTSSTYSYSLLDSVYAFQKAYRLPRTGVVGPETWRMLGRAQLLRPRYRNPEAHIEVDKTRQILMDVRDGEVDAILPVSSGATGNTPEGKHQIRWKALATTTWLGPAILYRTMTFFGNSFAIHGFPSVPPYPASHGCVRIPIWAADWLYERSSVGETVYVYH
jgi:hypothetical protein